MVLQASEPLGSFRTFPVLEGGGLPGLSPHFLMAEFEFERSMALWARLGQLRVPSKCKQDTCFGACCLDVRTLAFCQLMGFSTKS